MEAANAIARQYSVRNWESSFTGRGINWLLNVIFENGPCDNAVVTFQKIVAHIDNPL